MLSTPDYLTPQEIRDQALVNFRFFCVKLLKIKIKRFDRDKFIVQRADTAQESISESYFPVASRLDYFRWNIAQEIVVRVMMQQLRAGQPISLVICKARQFGISTLFCAWLFWQMWRSMHINAAIAAHRKPTLLGLVETINTFYENLPLEFRPVLRSKKTNTRVNKDELYFDDRKCQLTPVVAKSDALRGQNLDLALCTEVSSYDDPEDFFGGFIPALNVPYSLILESSPKYGYFRDRYMEAKTGKSGAKAIFLPWWIHRDLYSVDVVRGSKGKQKVLRNGQGELISFTKEERDIQRQLTKAAADFSVATGTTIPPISDDQMYWRQMQIAKLDDNAEWFNQEYPSDDISCFNYSSKGAFHIVMGVVSASVTAADEPFVGTVHSETYTDPSADQVIYLEPEPRKNYIDQGYKPGILIWERPIVGHLYTIGIDVADDHSADGADEDSHEHAYSVISVYCCVCRQQAASWRGSIDPHDLGDEAVKIGYLYNMAMINVEVNNMGKTTKDRIETFGLAYPITYNWPDFNVPGRVTKQTMWETNARSKPLMMGRWRIAVRDGLYRVRDPGLWEEMEQYVIRNGKYMSDGGQADRIIAAALSWMCVEQTEYGYSGVVLSSQGVVDKHTTPAHIREPLAALPPLPHRMPDSGHGDVWDYLDLT
jgi:hypothetical protein